MIVLLIVVIALGFEFVNGFHDTANVVATQIATRSLSPYQAIVIAAVFNLCGAFMGTKVATTISTGITAPEMITNLILISALLSAITWNLMTWSISMPSSSTHALIGSLVGAVVSVHGINAINYKNIINKAVIPMITSPVIAFFLALFICVLIVIVSKNKNAKKINAGIRELQLFSGAMLAFSHGANDAQKTMSIICLALFSNGIVSDAKTIPTWVISICAIAMSLGTLAGGMRIIKTLSTRVAKLTPVAGFASEISSGGLILLASHCGIPLSTTQSASGAIMGAGYLKSALNKNIIYRIAISWLVTIPLSMLLGVLFCHILHGLFRF